MSELVKKRHPDEDAEDENEKLQELEKVLADIALTEEIDYLKELWEKEK